MPHITTYIKRAARWYAEAAYLAAEAEGVGLTVAAREELALIRARRYACEMNLMGGC